MNGKSFRRLTAYADIAYLGRLHFRPGCGIMASGDATRMPEPEPSRVREFADHSTLWLLESPENLRDLLRLVAKEITERLDFRRAERLNRSFIPDNLQKQEADLLFRVPYRNGKREVWVYLLIEHQSKPDRLMGLRLLSYMVGDRRQ